MKKSLWIILLFIPVFLFSNQVVSFQQLPAAVQARVIPDLEGNVLITESFLSENRISALTRDLPSVMPGWPVAYTTANAYKGAIYYDMDDDGEMEVILGVGTKITALKLDGTPMPGWPVNNSYYIWSSPACGDIDGDGVNEIVATSRNNTTGNIGELYAYNLDGTPVDGFPVTLAGGGTMNATLADLDNDGALEILVNVRNSPQGWVYAYHGDGTVVEGWPFELDYVPGASISVADLNNNGSPEVVALSYNKIFVLDNAGNLLPGWPFTENGVTISYSQPTLYDMDGDGDKEILYGACSDNGGKVYAFQHDGTMVDGWPNLTDSWIFATVALGDIDNDGALDVVVGDQVSSQDAANYIYAWDLAGNALDNFPAGPTFAIYAQAAIADLDGDGFVEIMIDDNRYGIGYECYNHDGTHANGWPLECGTAWSSLTMQMTPVVGDLNNDGMLNIVGAATDIVNWVVEAYVWETDTTWNPDLAYAIIDGFNIRHDGNYPTAEIEWPEAPVYFQADLQDFNDILLSWNAPLNDQPLQYRIFLSETEIATIDASEEQYLLTAQPEGEYLFSLVALYADDQSQPVESELLQLTLPAPSNLDYEILADPAVSLQWQFIDARAFNEFVIYRDDNEIATVEEPAYIDAEVTAAGSYQYQITARFSGEYESAASNSVEVNMLNADEQATPELATRLLGNFPNPFNPTTNLKFSLAEAGQVSFHIYNLKGALVEKIAVGNLSPGEHSYLWQPQAAASGLYFIELQVAGRKYPRSKALLLK
ncbi:MAG: FG-GAP-like repeat-containing protein [Candidatus Cloacimonadales bacterium]